MVYTKRRTMKLPYLTTEVPPVPAVFKASAEDFEVVELPAYTPSGRGDHVFAWIEKRGVSTREAVRALCTELGIDPSDAGWAGLKDRHAVTRQWISLAGTTPAAAMRARAEGVEVLQAAYHDHKLRTGHLRANRFSIRLRQVDPSRISDIRRTLDQIEKDGLPNYYGEQRFGRHGDNARRALRWIRDGARAPKSRFHRKLEISALQSELFNRFVALRLETSRLGQVCAGNLVKKHDTGGLFVVEDAEEAQTRADAWEISPTGPIFGAKMRWPEGEARKREEQLLANAELTLAHFSKWKRIAAGSRRFVRVPVSELAMHVKDHTVRLDFTLPAGSYATILLREVVKGDASILESG
jgi:tRNA pseudouridine13 synthase